jgi:hypothetical protein
VANATVPVEWSLGHLPLVYAASFAEFRQVSRSYSKDDFSISESPTESLRYES